MFHRAIHIQPEFLPRHVWFGTQIEHRPVRHQKLTGRQAVVGRIGGGAGQQTALARPTLLRLDQLVLDPASDLDLVVHRVFLWPVFP